MNKELRQQILSEAVRIGDELVSLLKFDEEKKPGRKISGDLEKNILPYKTEIIYLGICGVILFLLELYKQTKEEKYLAASVEGMNWVERFCRDYPTDNYAFITGRMGVPYTMIHLFEITKDARYLEKALEIAKPCTNFLNSNRLRDDYINGPSGTLLVLLNLHAVTGDKWILESINIFIDHLIGRANHGPEGLYWGRSPMIIRGLCGFAHGAAGVGYVFLELGKYFHNESFFWIAEQAFLYESIFYDKKIKNWPDFRLDFSKPEYYEKYKNEYLNGNFDLFTTGADMNAWCHGAVGIGLSRLRAFELLGNSLYLSEMEEAIEKTKLTDIDSSEDDRESENLSICHGYCGNAELFLEAYKSLNREEYLAYAEKIAEKVLNSKEIYSSGFKAFIKTSLFLGSAGIGYFYLKLLEPLKVPSIMMPRVGALFNHNGSASKYPGITISREDIRKRVISKIFKRTLCVAETLMPDQLKNYFELKLPGNRNSEIKIFLEFMEKVIQKLPEEERLYVSDVFNLELETFRMDMAVESNTLLYMKETVILEEARNLINGDDDSLLQLELMLRPGIKIILTKWDWSPNSSNEWLKGSSGIKGEHPILLKPTYKGIVEDHLPFLAYFVLTAFQDGHRVGVVLQKAIDELDADSTEQKEIFFKTVVHQIKEAIASGILVEK